MKKSILVPAPVIVSIVATSSAYAARTNVQQAALEGGAFVGISLAATAAAGPVRLLVGSISAAILAKQTKSANDNTVLLEQVEVKQQHLDSVVSQQNLEIQQLEEQIVQRLSFRVLFSTGGDTLSQLDLQRVNILGSYLLNNPDLTVALNGHADPRGTDEYNNVLSQERAKAVKTELVKQGVGEGRISTKGHGSNFSTAAKGDAHDYELDRRVEIDMTSNLTNASVASN